MSDKTAKCKCEKALERAERVRRFEIELYWKRSAYFWTFIALAFAGYGALQVQWHETDKMKGLDFLLANVGFVASAAWFLVNKGSKYWQEHWEAQVDSLENCVTGPLYKKIIARVEKSRWKRFLTWFSGAPRLPKSEKTQVKSLSVPSASKINQLGSLYVAIVWIILGVRALLGPKFCVEIYGWSVSFPGVFFGLTLVSLGFFCRWGKAKLGDYSFAEDCREATNLGPCCHASDNCCQTTSTG